MPRALRICAGKRRIVESLYIVDKACLLERIGKGKAYAAEVGLTCLKDVAQGNPVAAFQLAHKLETIERIQEVDIAGASGERPRLEGRCRPPYKYEQVFDSGYSHTLTQILS